MLAEIYCDKFMDNGQQRGKITFHSGLNIVLGGDLGDNSIGKTTFLYVIDFCFGGNDYVKNADIKPIGEHEICWKLIFKNRAYWYSRNTNTPKTVFSCDSHYRHLAEVSIEDYCEFLAEQYHLLETRKSFREICSAWLRIYGKDNNNAKTPLQSFRSDKASSGINGSVQKSSQILRTLGWSNLNHLKGKSLKRYRLFPSCPNPQYSLSGKM